MGFDRDRERSRLLRSPIIKKFACSVCRSVFDGLFQVLVLIDLPDAVLSVAVEIDHGRGRSPESPLRSLDDLDAVVGMTALGDQRLLLEAQLLERGGILRVGVEVVLLERVQKDELLLGFGALGTRDQRHQVRQRDQYQNPDNDQNNE